MPATKPNTAKKPDYFFAVGRRKRAIARVRLYLKSTQKDELDIIVNNKPIQEYFHNPFLVASFSKPFHLNQ